jgi:hypothetical protein
MPLADVVRWNALARRALPGVYVDVLAILADGNGRVPAFTPDRRLISQDRAHLTQAGARYVGTLLFRHPLLRDLTPGESRLASAPADR